MRHDVRDVQKERLFLVSFDKIDAAFGQLSSEMRLIRIVGDERFAVVKGQRRHIFNNRVILAVVVGIRDAKELIEAIASRKKLDDSAQMPFAETGGGIPLMLADFRQQRFVRMNAFAARVIECSEHRHSDGVTTGHRGRSAGRTHAGSNVEISKFPTLLSHAIEIRSFKALRSKTANVRVPLIIGHDDHNVGSVGRMERRRRQRPKRERSANHGDDKYRLMGLHSRCPFFVVERHR